MSSPEMPELFAAYMRTDRPWLGTFFWGHMSDATLPDSYLEAARRLRSGATNNEDAERIFMPNLFLYRHAIELQLKRAIHQAAYLRRLQGDQSQDLEYSKVQSQLRSREVGHKIAELLALLDTHMHALGDDELSESAKYLLGLLDSADMHGTKFRYPDQLPDQHISIDIDGLFADIEALYRDLGGVFEYLVVRADEENS